MKEYCFYDGECRIIFDIVHLNERKKEITVAITNRGRISVLTLDLYGDGEKEYFEYGPMYEKIFIGSFCERR